MTNYTYWLPPLPHFDMRELALSPRTVRGGEDEDTVRRSEERLRPRYSSPAASVAEKHPDKEANHASSPSGDLSNSEERLRSGYSSLATSVRKDANETSLESHPANNSSHSESLQKLNAKLLGWLLDYTWAIHSKQLAPSKEVWEAARDLVHLAKGKGEQRSDAEWRLLYRDIEWRKDLIDTVRNTALAMRAWCRLMAEKTLKEVDGEVLRMVERVLHLVPGWEGKAVEVRQREKRKRGGEKKGKEWSGEDVEKVGIESEDNDTIIVDDGNLRMRLVLNEKAQ